MVFKVSQFFWWKGVTVTGDDSACVCVLAAAVVPGRHLYSTVRRLLMRADGHQEVRKKIKLGGHRRAYNRFCFIDRQYSMVWWSTPQGMIDNDSCVAWLTRAERGYFGVDM